MTHFEVHKFTDDRWLLDAVYPGQQILKEMGGKPAFL